MAALLGVFLSLISDLSYTWYMMIFFGMIIFAVLFWFNNPGETLLYLFVFTIPIDMTKGIVAHGGVYTPGLYISLSDLFFFGFFLVWIFQKMIVNREPFHVGPLGKAAILFTGYLWLSALMAYDVQAGIFAALRHSLYLVMFLSVSDYIRTTGQLRHVLLALACGFVLQIGVSVIQVGSGGSFQIQGIKTALPAETRLTFDAAGGLSALRPNGLLTHPNSLGNYLDFVMVLVLSIFFMGKKMVGRTWYWSVALLFGGMGALMLTLSRGAWIGFAVESAFFIAVAYHRKLIRTEHIARVIVSIIGVAMLLAVVYPAAYLRIVESDHRSTQARIIMIEQALLITKRNLLFGTGLGGYSRAAHENTPASFAEIPKEMRKVLLQGIVHNKYLLVSSESGLVGLALFLFLYYRAIRIFFRTVWRDKVEETIALAFTAGIIGQLVVYNFDNWYLGIPIEMAWLFFALLYAMSRINESGQDRAPPRSCH